MISGKSSLLLLRKLHLETKLHYLAKTAAYQVQSRNFKNQINVKRLETELPKFLSEKWLIALSLLIFVKRSVLHSTQKSER